MARLPETFNFGDQENIDAEKLLKIIQRMYVDLARAINLKADVYSRVDDGDPSETFLSQGSININTATDKVEILTNHPSATPAVVTWTTIS